MAAKLAVLTPYCFAAIGSAILSYYDAVLAHAVGLPFAPTCSWCVPQPQPPPSSLVRIAEISIARVKISWGNACHAEAYVDARWGP